MKDQREWPVHSEWYPNGTGAILQHQASLTKVSCHNDCPMWTVPVWNLGSGPTGKHLIEVDDDRQGHPMPTQFRRATAKHEHCSLPHDWHLVLTGISEECFLLGSCIFSIITHECPYRLDTMHCTNFLIVRTHVRRQASSLTGIIQSDMRRWSQSMKICPINLRVNKCLPDTLGCMVRSTQCRLQLKT